MRSWALRTLIRAFDIEPERVSATMLNLAVAYLGRSALGDVDRAIISLSEALDIQPDYASAYVNRANVYVTRGGPGDLGRALDDLEEALDIDPVLPSTHLMLGNAYVARRQDGDLQLAIAEFSRAIELSPTGPPPTSIAVWCTLNWLTGTSRCPTWPAPKSLARRRCPITAPSAPTRGHGTSRRCPALLPSGGVRRVGQPLP